MKRASSKQVEILQRIMSRGPWSRERTLMEEALSAHPNTFRELTAKDADTVICYGNDILVDDGKDPCTVDDYAEGRVDDLWVQDEVDELKEKIADLDLDNIEWLLNDQFLEQSMDAQDMLSEMQLDEPDDEEDIPF